MSTKVSSVAAAAALAAVVGLPGSAPMAQEVELPSQMVWTAYDTGSSGFNQAVAFGQALKNAYDVDLRVLPGANDISRMIPVKTGRAQFSAMGIGSFFAQEGMDVFAAEDWGPQRLRLLVTAVAANAISVGVAADTGVKEYKDLKGKRVAWVVGSAALNNNMRAILAFADLTWDDVQKVEFSGYGASWKGMVNNQVDAAIASTISGVTRELEASPRGIVWPPTPHDDAAGWERLQAVAPYYQKHMATAGSGGISEENPYESPNYPYPIMLAYDTQDTDLVYNVVKAIDVLYPEYKDGAPGVDGWALDRQNFTWVMPFHEGAIRYFKEKGIWTGEMQAHNDSLVKRQDVLTAAWEAFKKGDPPEEAYATEWPKARAEALKGAGMNPIWEE